MAIPLQSFFCIFLGCLNHSCCPSNVFIWDVIPSCPSAHSSHHCHFIYFRLCVLSSRGCPGLCISLHSAVSSTSNHSMHFKRPPPADLFILTPNRFLLETFSNAAITEQRLFHHIIISNTIASAQLFRQHNSHSIYHAINSMIEVFAPCTNSLTSLPFRFNHCHCSLYSLP